MEDRLNSAKINSKKQHKNIYPVSLSHRKFLLQTCDCVFTFAKKLLRNGRMMVTAFKFKVYFVTSVLVVYISMALKLTKVCEYYISFCLLYCLIEQHMKLVIYNK